MLDLIIIKLPMILCVNRLRLVNIAVIYPGYRSLLSRLAHNGLLKERVSLHKLCIFLVKHGRSTKLRFESSTHCKFTELD